MNEFYLAKGRAGRVLIRFCLLCGGRAPRSRRESLFAHVTDAEERRIAGLFAGVRTVADAISKFGEPDATQDVAALYSGGGGNAPQRGEAVGALVYRSLSDVADIIFEVGLSESVRGTWCAKYVGPRPA